MAQKKENEQEVIERRAAMLLSKTRDAQRTVMQLGTLPYEVRVLLNSEPESRSREELDRARLALSQFGVWSRIPYCDSRECQLKVARLMRFKLFSKETCLFEEREDPSCLYILLEGTVRAWINELGREKVLTVLQPISIIGDAVIETFSRRNAAVTTNEEVSMIVVDREQYWKSVKSVSDYESELERRIGILRNVWMFRGMEERQLREMAAKIPRRQYAPQQVLLRQAELSPEAFVISSGECAMLQSFWTEDPPQSQDIRFEEQYDLRGSGSSLSIQPDKRPSTTATGTRQRTPNTIVSYHKLGRPRTSDESALSSRHRPPPLTGRPQSHQYSLGMSPPLSASSASSSTINPPTTSRYSKAYSPRSLLSDDRGQPLIVAPVPPPLSARSRPPLSPSPKAVQFMGGTVTLNSEGGNTRVSPLKNRSATMEAEQLMQQLKLKRTKSLYIKIAGRELLNTSVNKILSKKFQTADDGKPPPLATVETKQLWRGNVFGEWCIIDHRKESKATVYTVTNVEVFVLNRALLLSHFNEEQLTEMANKCEEQLMTQQKSLYAQVQDGLTWEKYRDHLVQHLAISKYNEERRQPLISYVLPNLRGDTRSQGRKQRIDAAAAIEERKKRQEKSESVKNKRG